MTQDAPSPAASAAPAKPDTLKRPVRAFVKRNGKRLVRKVAATQARQSTVPNTPKIANSYFPFLRAFEDEWRTIRAEAEAVLAFRDAIPGFQEVSPDQYRLATGKSWRTHFLYGFGERLATNTKLTPRTAELLEQVPNLQTAMFSILAPGYHIPAHTGVTKGILRAHLGLIVPDDWARCRIRVADTVTAWRPGETFVFDDTYEHEVWNETDQERVILIFDFDRPMRPLGRALNKAVVAGVKRTAFYKDPRRNMADAEARLEAAIGRADEIKEDMSERA